jgi:hypothetical protein
MKKQKLVAIYGGTDLNPAVSNFVGKLTRCLLAKTDVVLVTGGFDFREDAAKAQSTDRSVADAAEAFAKENGFAPETRLQTWLPEAAKDRKLEKVHRFEKGMVRHLEGSARKRRLAIVNGVDALITVRGQVQTALVLDMAQATSRPALPLPFTGGDSKEFWDENKSYYQARFHLSDNQLAAWEGLHLEQPRDEESEAAIRVCDEIAGAVNRVLKRSCLVLMPFRENLEGFYKNLEVAIVQAGFEAIRLDHKLYAGDVRTTFKRLVEECEGIIADVTDSSPNVLYELGHAHAYDRQPLLLVRRSQKTDNLELPFYLKPQRVQLVDEEGKDLAAVQTYLESVLIRAR